MRYSVTATTAAIRIIVTMSGRASDSPDTNDGQDIKASSCEDDAKPDARAHASSARYRVICEDLKNAESTRRGHRAAHRGNLLNRISYRVFVPTPGTVARMTANSNDH